VAAALEHPAIDVGEPNLAAWHYAAPERAGEVRAAARDVENAIPGARAHDRYGECLPDAVQSERHQVVHEVVALGDAVENRPHPPRLVSLGNPLVSEICVVFQSERLLIS